MRSMRREQSRFGSEIAPLAVEFPSQPQPNEEQDKAGAGPVLRLPVELPIESVLHRCDDPANQPAAGDRVSEPMKGHRAIVTPVEGISPLPGAPLVPDLAWATDRKAAWAEAADRLSMPLNADLLITPLAGAARACIPRRPATLEPDPADGPR